MGFITWLFWMTWGTGIMCTIGSFIVQPRSQAPGFAAIGIACLIVAGIWTYFIVKAPAKNAAKTQQKYLEKENEQKHLSTLRGLEKYRAMDEADAAAYARGVEAIRQLGMIMQESVYQEKEKDWAVLGGLADGVAGPVAGIATAANAIQENVRIREENEARRAWGVQQNLYMSNLAAQAEEKRPYAMSMEELQKHFRADFWKKPSEFMKMLNMETVKIHPEPDSHAVTIVASWTRKEDICIDGSIRAMLYDDEHRYLGCAYLALPKVGTASERGEISGICANPLSKNIASVEYEAISLWELAHIQAPKNAVEYSHDEEEKALQQREADLQRDLKLSAEKYEVLKYAEKKAADKLRLKRLVRLLPVVALLVIVVFAIIGINNAKLDRISQSYYTECEKTFSDTMLNKFTGLERVDFSIISVEEVKSMSGHYTVSVRVDLTTNDADAEMSKFNLILSVERALPNDFLTDSGETVTYTNYDATDDYFCEEMIYIYLDGELISEPHSIY